MKIEAMKITLHEMRFYAYHGVFPQEQRVGNQFVVELTFWADVAGSVHSDELEETISYADVYEVVKAENIAVSEEAIDAEIAKMAEAYKIAPEKMKEYVSAEQREELAMDLKIQEAVDFLVAEAKLQ